MSGKGWLLGGALGALWLSGCSETGGALAFLGASGGGEQRGVRSYEIFDGALRVRGPEGYCIDTSASAPRRGFVVLASCARAADVGISPDVDALLTVQVGAEGSAFVTGQESDLARLFAETDAGAPGEGATVAATATAPGVVYVTYEGGASPLEGTTGPFRRALFDIRGRSVTVVLMRFAGRSVSPREAEALLSVTVSTMRAANPG